MPTDLSLIDFSKAIAVAQEPEIDAQSFNAQAAKIPGVQVFTPFGG